MTPAALALLALLFSAPSSEGKGGGATRLRITYPESPLVTQFTRVRIAGSCDPSCTVTIGGKPSRVYPTGAFVGLVLLAAGDATVEVVARLGGTEDRAPLAVTCRDPLVTSPESPLTADRKMLQPAVDMILQPGDELRVQCKGSPGMKASWSLGKIVKNAPMEEVPPLKGDDGEEIGGIYRAFYRIREGDRISGARARFSLSDARGRAVRARSPGRITLAPHARIVRGGVGEDGAPASADPGGAQAWRMEPGTRLNLCGEAGDHYRALLSSGERWWVPKKSVRPVKGEGAWPPSSAGPPSVERTERGAAVRIPVSGAPPVRISGGKDPRELVVEVFGVSPVRERMRAGGAGPVEMVEIPETKADILSAVVRMRGRAQWGHAVQRTQTGLALEVKAPPGREPGKIRVVIDPGHGGAQTGAMSPTGLREKDVNLEVAREAAAFLKERGVGAVLTRDDDRALTLDERIARARLEGADIFVSVHHDSCPGCCDPLSRRGAGAYYGVPQSEALAGAVLARLDTAGAPSRGIRRGNFAVVLPTDYLAVLVECSYLSHPEDEARILSAGYARETGRLIAAGVLDFVREAG
ncbi:MAG: N-acetylmuramoyl-L-alanine amidase [Chlamydiota bacterium]